MTALPEVKAETDATIVGPGQARLGTMMIGLEYDPDDPLCVKLVLGSNTGDPCRWDTSRDVLKAAFIDLLPAGLGDLTCVPIGKPHDFGNLCPGWVRLTLSGRDDQQRPMRLELLVPPFIMRRFLKATFDVVPAEDEHKRLAIPDTIAGIVGDIERGSA